MNAEEFKTALASRAFRSELHHLLWVSPFTNRGVRDEGWHCREHALIVGVLALLHGFSAVAIHGKAEFVMGPTGGVPPGCIRQDPHTWVRIDGVGSCDLSVRLNSMPSGLVWADWQDSYLLGSKFVPNDSTFYSALGDRMKHENACALASHQPDARAAHYLQIQGEHIGLQQIENSMKWCNSPMTDRLKNMYPTRSDIYAKAILHLDEILCGKGQSVIHIPQMAAWGAISKQPGNGRLELFARIPASMGILGAANAGSS